MPVRLKPGWQWVPMTSVLPLVPSIVFSFPLKRGWCQTDWKDEAMFLSIEGRSQLSFVSPNITADSRFRLSVAWVVGVTRARASRLDSRLRVNECTATCTWGPGRRGCTEDKYLYVKRFTFNFCTLLFTLLLFLELLYVSPFCKASIGYLKGKLGQQVQAFFVPMHKLTL